MARVHTAKARKDYPKQGIAKGDVYYYWQLYKQPKRMSKTRPRPSQLTGSAKLSQAYSIDETLQDAAAGWTCPEDAISSIDDAVSEIRDLADEYEDSANNIRENFSESPTADECEEKAQSLRDWAEELESASSEIGSLNPDDFRRQALEDAGQEDDDDADEITEFDDLSPEAKELFLDAARDQVDGVGGCPL